MLELLLSLYLQSQVHNSFQKESFLQKTISPQPLPQVEEEIQSQLSAESFLVTDVASNTVLAKHNAKTPLPIASLTKLMTALIIIENHDMYETVYISSNAHSAEGSHIGLYRGEAMTIENLLTGLLVKSGNDAAIALAEYHAKTEDAFVEKMNERAEELGMKNTQFKNPHGLDEDGAYSTAEDLLLLAQSFWKHEKLQNIVRQRTAIIHSLTNKDRTIVNTNKLLGNEVQGIKTGTTPAAGECLMLFVERDNKSIFTVVLGSKQRFSDSRELVDAIWQSVRW